MTNGHLSGLPAGEGLSPLAPAHHDTPLSDRAQRFSRGLYLRRLCLAPTTICLSRGFRLLARGFPLLSRDYPFLSRDSAVD